MLASPVRETVKTQRRGDSSQPRRKRTDECTGRLSWRPTGLAAFEQLLVQSGKSGQFCFDDMPTMADCVLVPQVFSARRFNVDVSQYPRVAAIDALCNTLPAFISAHPKNQADFSP